MRIWQKALLSTLITLAIGGIYLLVIFEHRKNPGVVNKAPEQNLAADDVAVVRMMWMTSFDDTLALEGKSVWMKNGYTMPYYPYAGGRIIFAKQTGLIPSAQRLDIKKILKASPPALVDDGISHGSHQVFALFALPGSAELYATAIGVIDGHQEAYFSDMLFYYDDPHKIYDNWSKETWGAVDAHQVKPGMNELQTSMAIGQKMHTDDPAKGNRTIAYDQAGKHWTVTFANDRATTIHVE